LTYGIAARASYQLGFDQREAELRTVVPTRPPPAGLPADAVVDEADQQSNAPMSADEYYAEQAERMWARGEQAAAENRRTWLDPRGTGKSFWDRE
jgi:hypothetical protein